MYAIYILQQQYLIFAKDALYCVKSYIACAIHTEDPWGLDKVVVAKTNMHALLFEDMLRKNAAN